MDYKITLSDEDDATLVKMLDKENAIRADHNLKAQKGDVPWDIIPDVRAYAEQVVKWHAEVGAKQMQKAAKDAVLAKVQTDPASVTAEDKAVLGIT